MRKHLICAAVLVSVIGASPPAYAWGWDGIIRPWSHVIDLKRLADSVQETLQMVEALRNEVKKLQNQIQAMRKIDLYPREMEAAIKNALQFPDMKTIFDFRDTYKPLEDFYHETVDAYKKGIDPTSVMHTYHSAENLVQQNIITKIIQNQTERQKLSAAIATSEDDSLLSEQQKANQLAALDALGSIDEAHMIGTSYTAAVKDQETQLIKRNIEREYANALTVYPYDPYHPTEFDKRNNASKSKAFGFLKFGQ